MTNWETLSRLVEKKAPRKWGKVFIISEFIKSSRITPTGVGKRGREAVESLVPQVHPHESGEKSSALDEETLSPGSPPHTWGKLVSV